MIAMSTETLLNTVLESLDQENSGQLVSMLSHAHPADIAEIIQLLPGHKRHMLIELMGTDFDPNTLSYLDDSVRDQLLDSFVQTELSTALARMDEVDALHILENLDGEERRSLLRTLKPNLRAMLEDGLSYQDDSAGRIMSYEFIALPASWTVGQAMLFLKTALDFPEETDDIFIVNEKRAPIGKITLSTLIQAGQEQVLQKICKPLIKLVEVTTTVHEICLLFQKYLINSLPIVSKQGKIVGVIQAHNILDTIAADAQESFLHSAGVSESDFYDSLFPTFIARIKWIFIAGMYAMMAAFIMFQFQSVIEKNVIITSIAQVVTALCATSGLQVSTVTIRAILEKQIMFTNMKRAILKEFILGTLNGAVCGLVFGILLAILAFALKVPLFLCGIVFTAVLCGMMFVSITGFLLPVALSRIGIDPAISSGPVISSLSDACCLLVLFGLARLIL